MKVKDSSTDLLRLEKALESKLVQPSTKPSLKVSLGCSRLSPVEF